ncbi:MAG TPA: coenzyme F420-0:L-glutamate ligase [Candidatus Paceibacterota bacterium]|nr:coenzyme F420-0:L-glutamate ligase [Candidatus Paceibacterota bacterium]
MAQSTTNSVPLKMQPNKGKELAMHVGSEKYLRIPIKTRMITEKDNIIEVMREYVGPFVSPGDILFVSEKVVCITQGRIVPFKDIKPTRLARFLASKVDNKRGTKDFRGFGHGTSLGMQLFIEEAGVPRVLFAALVSAITRPFGIKGLFYVISGKRAKAVDCPMSFTLYPYNHYGKRSPLHPNKVAREMSAAFGCEVVIVDANYRGVFSLGKSRGAPSEKFIYQVFKDNPAGQSEEMTPFFIVRKE